MLADAHEHPGGPSFQATASAVAAIHDGVASARTALANRLGATADRLSAAAANYTATDAGSASALDALFGEID
ncbi:hypothetical protein LV457_14155 [Mycobacterium sp. MYCO198283]|nr:type VII secretion target [Mycobacterium sp. MYCO198283]MCG5433422.1 hypothetical protein [Mycobacterium sp. MYCO198283]